MTTWKAHKRCVNRSPQRGYVLVEVVVSMMVLTVGILSVSRSFSVATIARGLSQDYTDSRYLAAERMWKTIAMSEAGTLTLGSAQGKFPVPWQKFSWELKVEETTIPYEVSVKITRVDEPQRGSRGRNRNPAPRVEEQPEKFFARAVITLKWKRRNVEYQRWVATLVPPIDLDEEMNGTP